MLDPGPLVDLAHALGIPDEALWAAERPDRLHHTFPVGAGRVRSLNPAVLRGAAQSLDGALSVEFQIDDHVAFTAGPHTTHHEAVEFLTSASAEPFELIVTVDKQAFASTTLPTTAGLRTVVYLFPAALVSLLREGIGAVEKELWPAAPSRLAVLVVGTSVVLEGDYLFIGGMASVDAARRFAARLAPDPARAAEVLSGRDRLVGWDNSFLERLTPAHFRLAGQCEDLVLKGLLDAQLIKLAILFTCDRARPANAEDGTPRIRAEFRGAEHSAVVNIDEAHDLPGLPDASVVAAADLVDWSYRPSPGKHDWLADRLPFVQTRVARALESTPEDDRLRTFAMAAPGILDGVQWQWRAFVDARVTEFLGQVQALEAAVADTVEKVAARVGAMTKSLSDAMLAAVAVLIGSFLAAAFTQPFNARLFRAGVLAYAAYMVVFPGAIGMVAAARSYVWARRSFDHQRRQFEAILAPDRVGTIVGDRLRDAGREFKAWWGIVASVYAVVATAAVWAAVALPDIVGKKP